ncbi:MAG: helix-turn-helix transcriptional regulator [Devosia sp.]|nr:helix-turn-helix transcriptional regulator [Devosia sp.]
MFRLLRLQPLSDPDLKAADQLDRLTPKELKVAQGILDGATNKDIASALGNSPRTVEVHRARVFEKLGIRSATDLVRIVAMATAGSGRPNGSHLESEARTSEEAIRRDIAAIASAQRLPTEKGSASMADIITGIVYRRHIDAEAINVFMSWDSSGKASGYLLAPESLESELQERGYPPLDQSRPLSSAISYGLFLALQANLPLCLTGDRNVWDESWGALPSTAGVERRRLM